jgi:hypothetical protein
MEIELVHGEAVMVWWLNCDELLQMMNSVMSDDGLIAVVNWVWSQLTAELGVMIEIDGCREQMVALGICSCYDD